jgi:sulfite exporter TauE/SafE
LGMSGGSLSTGGEAVILELVLNTIASLHHFLVIEKMPVSGSIVSILAYSFLFGLKHAVEPDHLAAVSSIVSERKNPLGSIIVGGWWGCGHTLSLLLAGLIVSLLGFDLREEHLRPLDLLVAAMLIALGLNALRKLAGERSQSNEIANYIPAQHSVHLHKIPRESSEYRSIGLRPLLAGMIHGLAGSAALLLLLIPIIPSLWLKLTYLLVFGAGSIVGMMLMSWLVGLPAHLTAARFARVHFGVRAISGSAGVLFGVLLLYEFVTV